MGSWHRRASIPSGRRRQLAIKVVVRAGYRVDCQRQGLLSVLFASGWSALTEERGVGPI
jgi:hypothetical protein